MSDDQSIVTNETGAIIAWVHRCEGENAACRRAMKSGRNVHIIPAHTDPRAAEWTLAMPDHHFHTFKMAVQGLEEAWANAVDAYSVAERDAAYARKLPVRIRHGVGRPDGYVYR